MRRALVTLFALAARFGWLTGCRTAIPAAPAAGGPAWFELTSEHFVVWTDGEATGVRELIRQLEQFRQATADVAFPGSQSAGRSLAIIVRDDDELAAINNDGEPRALTRNAAPPFWRCVIIMSVSGGDRRVVAHELTHLVSASVIRHQPRWLAEGMATYFETTQLDERRNLVTVGALPVRLSRRALMAPVAAVLDWRGMAPNRVEYTFYRTAWALFAYLMNEHEAELSHYLWLVDHSDSAETARRAWDAAFHALPIADFDLRIRQWLSSGSHQLVQYRVVPRSAPITTRRMSDADAYAMRAFLFGGPRPEQEARGATELGRALELEPANLFAWLLETWTHRPPSIATARSIAAAHPDDWRAWWLAVQALETGQGDAAELAQAHDRACELIARDPPLTVPLRCADPQLGQSRRGGDRRSAAAR
jgi:hypothetical protein